MSTACYIEVQNNGNNVVYAGQELCGSVRLTLTEERHLHGIYIQIYGKGSCQWAEGRAAFSGRADYLNEIIYFVGGPNDSVRIDRGTYTYNFRCLLPPKLPGSFEGEFGYIRYSVRVVLASFSILPDQKFQQQFRVVRQLNLNDYPALRQSIDASATYKYRFSDFLLAMRFVMRQPEIVVRLPRNGFVPLENMNVEIHVMDQNGDANCEFRVKLIKQTHYCAQTPKRKRTEKQTIVKKIVCVRIQNVYEIVNAGIEVPVLAPSDLTTNNIINVSYHISISASTGFWNRKTAVGIPITIGTIGTHPIQNVELNTTNALPANANDSEHTSNAVQTLPTHTEINDDILSES